MMKKKKIKNNVKDGRRNKRKIKMKMKMKIILIKMTKMNNNKNQNPKFRKKKILKGMIQKIK
jgi:hypothetical protein